MVKKRLLNGRNIGQNVGFFKNIIGHPGSNDNANGSNVIVIVTFGQMWYKPVNIRNPRYGNANILLSFTLVHIPKNYSTHTHTLGDGADVEGASPRARALLVQHTASRHRVRAITINTHTHAHTRSAVSVDRSVQCKMYTHVRVSAHIVLSRCGGGIGGRECRSQPQHHPSPLVLPARTCTHRCPLRSLARKLCAPAPARRGVNILSAHIHTHIHVELYYTHVRTALLYHISLFALHSFLALASCARSVRSHANCARRVGRHTHTRARAQVRT